MRLRFDVNDWLGTKGLWVVLILTLIASVRHVSTAFLSLEAAGTHAFWGWAPAIAIDSGLLVTTWRLRDDKNNRLLWVGFWIFLLTSGFANVDNALHHVGLGDITTWAEWRVAKVIAFAGLLPLLVAMMAEVASKQHTANPPGAQLATTNQPANNTPSVNVANPQPRRWRVGNRTLRAISATKRANINPQPAPEVANVANSNNPAPSALPTNGVANRQTATAEVLDSSDITQEMVDAIHAYRLDGSYDKAGRRLGLSGEAVRKRVNRARELAPDFTAAALEEETIAQ